MLISLKRILGISSGATGLVALSLHRSTSELFDHEPEPDGVSSRWKQFESEAARLNKNKVRSQQKPILQELMLAHLYPRLDVHVTEAQNHLLKSPWVIHPKTGEIHSWLLPCIECALPGRVCVPFDPFHCEDFNPEEVNCVTREHYRSRQH